jgi:hypothetical protein
MQSPRDCRPRGLPPGKEVFRIPSNRKPSRPPYNSQLLAVLVALAALLVVLGLNLESTHAAAVLVATLGVARLLLNKR